MNSIAVNSIDMNSSTRIKIENIIIDIDSTIINIIIVDTISTNKIDSSITHSRVTVIVSSININSISATTLRTSLKIVQ